VEREIHEGFRSGTSDVIIITTMHIKGLICGSVTLGILFVILAVVYWLEPAGSLPSYFPGYASGSSVIHFKHGLGCLIIGLALFAFAWFKSGPKSSGPTTAGKI
jgi:hypothetical protein